MRDLISPDVDSGQASIVDAFERVDAEVVNVTRRQGTSQLTARVKLRFKLSDQIETRTGEIATTVTLNENEGFHWRDTKRRIIAAAWRWLNAYFDGVQLGIDCRNLFADILGTDISKNASGLTSEEERSLQRELRSIEAEFAAL